MPTSAYILIECIPGKSTDLKKIIAALEEVKTVHLVTGPYDLIIFVEASDLKTIGENVIKKIQSTGFVVKTLTCVTVDRD
ncbi:hypothetical protein A2526_00285 [candidate division WOR-1 bacterium RIFOXYD2_FULL_36_8]|uniref:Transcription regulator AsnC/Lrp ligand binding domain-containing protein n=1 Tax=candidate division WOR-1 bacterium RIFOXYB2_FULL_36_35 TaxID=1802578 RepID=A0A1F4S3Q0_UNCSA|nr:MAG: hypothetical protein A2230_09320 [candidate division WOR-1 bacterium RIFOXYA2_FULL_36_21]OGC15055.1 MAG: hypothetical protein A2290_09140 [candidate division WOR-1 bacterium RIFOXYB2_FULL_36_35]OGC16437.1 MAG: hypothetical protein A2282_03245 [candidate division WOR-1 bacterium RIFOXYA12_FULL_36_13]OGC37512.1 MAG: hypothetical protein A2526_00285 [candidate division WOR-1 bacterium RIFOXYD2_FULL_36_8]